MLEVDGGAMPQGAFAKSKLLLDGDLFRMESPEATYDGRFTIDTTVTPMRIDIEFVEGPEAGNTSYGVFELEGDRLTICLGLVGASRPTTFASRPGTGHALERLRRASAARPAGITGGSAPPPRAAESVSDADLDDFDAPESPMLQRLEGTWLPLRLVMNGEEMASDWLRFGSRVGTGNESTVVFGGQVMLHVKMRIDDSVAPLAVDYLHLRGTDKGKVSHGIMEWLGDDVRFLMPAAGQPRPSSFSEPSKGQTLSHWTRRKDA